MFTGENFIYPGATPTTTGGPGISYTNSPNYYENNTQNIHSIEELAGYLKKEFERLDRRIDEIEQREISNTTDIKQDISRTKSEVIRAIRFI